MLSYPSFGGPLDALIGILNYGKCMQLESLTDTDIACSTYFIRNESQVLLIMSPLKIHTTEDILPD